MYDIACGAILSALNELNQHIPTSPKDCQGMKYTRYFKKSTLIKNLKNRFDVRTMNSKSWTEYILQWVHVVEEPWNQVSQVKNEDIITFQMSDNFISYPLSRCKRKSLSELAKECIKNSYESNNYRIETLLGEFQWKRWAIQLHRDKPKILLGAEIVKAKASPAALLSYYEECCRDHAISQSRIVGYLPV